MSELDKKPKFGHEMRLLAASLLSMGVILLWARFFSPKASYPPSPGESCGSDCASDSR